jgi:diaminohydroxyphosphoribosylaminopyrimidine deaminase/5-amino-6-(5-phosphoribosylamino)uracil reductase
MDDPNPVNSGRGFERLRAAGIDVFTGVCEEEARRLNEPFACWIRTKNPFVTLKSAMTLDGQLAMPQSGKKKGKNSGKHRSWITSEESRAEVHRIRHASDALLTGIGTILADDPLLTDRSGLPRRKRLLRVILDSRLRLSAKSRIVKTSDDDLVVFTSVPVNSAKARKLQDAGVEVIRAKTRGGRIDLSSVLAELGRREILSILLEAGPALNGAALAAGIVHKLFLFYAPKIAGENRVPFALAPKLNLPPLSIVRTQQFGPDFAVEAYLHDVLR